MAEYFPVVIEREENGTFTAYIAGLPGVYAAADTRRSRSEASGSRSLTICARFTNSDKRRVQLRK